MMDSTTRQKRVRCFRLARCFSLKGVLRLKKTNPQGEMPVVENKPRSCEDDGAWGCLQLNVIEAIVRQASHALPQDFRKILFTASLLNKHWKTAIDEIVDKLDLRMKTMEKLDLRVHLQWSLDALLRRFSNARALRLTSIDGDTLTHVRQHTHIEDLELYAVDFSSLRTLKGLSRLHFLRGLKFRHSPSLDDRALKAVAGCSNLTLLDLTGCSLITGEGMKAVGTISSLETLFLGDCSALSIDGLLALSSLFRLKTLNLSGVHHVGNSVLHMLSELPSLTDLDISMCPNVTDVGLWYLAKKVFLKSLNLFSCDKLTDDGLKAIAKQSSLRKLNLGWCCWITDFGIGHLCELDQLSELRLSWVPITHDGVTQLTQLSSLSLLDMRGCDNNPAKLTEGVATLRRALPDGQLTVHRS